MASLIQTNPIQLKIGAYMSEPSIKRTDNQIIVEGEIRYEAGPEFSEWATVSGYGLLESFDVLFGHLWSGKGHRVRVTIDVLEK